MSQSKTQQWMFFSLGCLKQLSISTKTLANFFQCTNTSVLTGGFGNLPVFDLKQLDIIVRHPRI